MRPVASLCQSNLLKQLLHEGISIKINSANDKTSPACSSFYMPIQHELVCIVCAVRSEVMQMEGFRMTVTYRDWVPTDSETRVQSIATQIATSPSDAIFVRIQNLVEQNRVIHEEECFNLNPATNIMNPKAEALLSSGIGSRPSLGYTGDKYEMGLEAIEEIEVIAAQICAEVFEAEFCEIRVPSGAIANLYGFMAT